MNGSRERLGDTFDAVADLYDAARPSYPDQLFDDLVDLALLGPGARLLEVGCGTGQATRPLLERGYRVVCVEPGARLAGRARLNLAGLPVDIRIARLESWPGEACVFDLVYAATAWHWVDPAVRYRRAHRLLRAGGHLAFWSALHAFPVGFDPFFTEIQEVYDSIGESHPGDWPPPPPERVPDLSSEVQGSGLFEDVQVRSYLWETSYTAEEYIALLNTFSGHIAMGARNREHLYREVQRRIESRPRQSVRRHWHAILHVARRVDTP